MKLTRPKSSWERRAEEASAELERVQAQAIEISCLLADAGVGSCTLPEGVRLLIRRRDALRDALVVALPPDVPVERFLAMLAASEAVRAGDGTP